MAVRIVFFSLALIELEAALAVRLHVGRHVDRPEVAHGDLAVGRVQRDFGAQVRTVNRADMLLRRAQVAGVLEGDPRMPGLEEHRQHLAPQRQRRDLPEELEFPARRLVLVPRVRLFERLAGPVVQVGAVRRREQCPVGAFHHPLHEQVRNPVRGVHVVRAPTIVAGVLAQFQELLDVQVPGLQVTADRALAFAALIDRDGRVVDHLQEGHHALTLAVGALDVGAERAHRRPVVAKAARVLGQQGVLLDRLVDALEVVRDRGQVARRQLRVAGAAVEQRGRRAHEVERRQHLVELDRALFPVDFVQRESHGDPHEERLRKLEAPAFVVQEVAVVQRLQAEVVELQVPVGVQRCAQAREVVLAQLARPAGPPRCRTSRSAGTIRRTGRASLRASPLPQALRCAPCAAAGGP